MPGSSGDEFTASSADRLFIKSVRPGLGEGNFRVTSDQDINYNCLGWALGDARYWTPAPGMAGGQANYYHWPEDLPPRMTLDVVAEIFRREGYEECGTDVSHEPGIAKVALYEERGEVAHVARQLPDTGWWTSKLGVMHDIEHAQPGNIEGSPFGGVALVMCRPADGEGPPTIHVPGT